MKQICCIDCVHCNGYIDPKVLDRDDVPATEYPFYAHYTCDAGSIMKEIEDPEKVIDCPDFVQYIEDI